MPPPSGKVLIIRGGAIGDFILTLPAVAAVRQQFPDARLELLTYPRVAELALAAGLVDHAASIDARPLASFFARAGPLPDALCDYFNGFAVILSYLFDPDRIFQDNVARCSKAQFLAGPSRPDERTGRHATEVFLEPLKRLAIFDPDPVPALQVASRIPGPQDVLRAGPLLSRQPPETASPSPEPWLALHPGSGSERKNWPEENWAELLRRLVMGTNLRLLLVGGEAEGERLRRLEGLIPSNRRKTAESLPLSELSRLLQQCGAYVGHDSGISHLAAALGLPGLILWGETREEIWRPRSERVTLIKGKAGLGSLEVEEVWGRWLALQKSLPVS